MFLVRKADEYYFCSKINITEEYAELITKRGTIIISRNNQNLNVETKHKTKS